MAERHGGRVEAEDGGERGAVDGGGVLGEADALVAEPGDAQVVAAGISLPAATGA